jgi:hypothetical protein
VGEDMEIIILLIVVAAWFLIPHKVNDRIAEIEKKINETMDKGE